MYSKPSDLKMRRSGWRKIMVMVPAESWHLVGSCLTEVAIRSLRKGGLASIMSKPHGFSCITCPVDALTLHWLCPKQNKTTVLAGV